MKVSVIIPVKNEEKHIRGLLDSLLTQSRKADEIVMVDGGSTDRTIEIINGYKKGGMPIKLIEVDEALPGRGRNIAIEAAQYDIIAMTDGGIVLNQNWLEKLIVPFEKDSSIEVVYGTYDCYPETLFEKCFCIVYMPAAKQIEGSNVNSPFLASSAIKKDIWEKIGGFKENLRATEDMIFIKEIEKGGFKIKIVPDAKVYWRPRKNLKETFSLSFRYAICDAIMNFHILRYLKKYLLYLTGIYLLYLATKDPIWIILLLIGFLLNLLLVCRKHWKDFLSIIRNKPYAIFYIILIILTLDISQLIGFLTGKIGKR
ncbi:MAG: glycosyltransferase [bacterium]|nr:glycosyltransferase [bacterium]